MKKWVVCLIAAVGVVMLSGVVISVRAAVSETNQQTLKTQYVGKVLVFRKLYRMANQLEYAEDGTLKGNHRAGYWATDGAVQVKDLDFKKDRLVFKCTKLWAAIKDDGQLHFFPASVMLKGKTDYPENEDITFRTGEDAITVETVTQWVNNVFLGGKDSLLSSAPQPIVAYIQKAPTAVDYDPATGAEFSGTPPKAISQSDPQLPREAQLVGQAGRENFVIYIDSEGRAAVVGFTHLLQYGAEEATIDAVKQWKFQPAMKDGKPVAVRMAAFVDFKRPGQQK